MVDFGVKHPLLSDKFGTSYGLKKRNKNKTQINYDKNTLKNHKNPCSEFAKLSVYQHLK